MKRYWKYLLYVLRHRWYIMVECWRVGLYWRGLVHDWSKVRPSEFLPYARVFYEADGTPRKPHDTGDPHFDYAWLLHQKRNDHHWQWWVLPTDTAGEKILPLSPAARLEMLCDWRGAGKAQGTPDTLAWYQASKDKLRLHPETREWVEGVLYPLQGPSMNTTSRIPQNTEEETRP